jgi:hypothetical protein
MGRMPRRLNEFIIDKSTFKPRLTIKLFFLLDQQIYGDCTYIWPALPLRIL